MLKIYDFKMFLYNLHIYSFIKIVVKYIYNIFATYVYFRKFTTGGTWMHKYLEIMKRVRPNLSDISSHELIENYT